MTNGNEQGAFGSDIVEEGRFLKYLASRYGAWTLALAYRTLYAFRLPMSPLYRQWVSEGRPETGKRFGTGEAPITEEDIIQEMQEALATGGRIPLGEFREQQPWLEAKGFELVTEGEFGLPLPEEGQFFRRAEEVPEEIDEFGQLTEQAERISELTGAPIADIIAALTGTPTPDIDEGISPFQQGQLGLQRERFEFEKAQTEQERVASFRNLLTQQASQRDIARMMGQVSEGDLQRRMRQEFSTQFEDFRRQILSGTAPRGYFTRELLRGQANPFAPQPETIQDTIKGIEEDLSAEQKSLRTVRDRAKMMETRHLDLAGSGITHPPTAEEFKAIGLLNELKEREDRVDRLEEALVRAEDKFVSSGEAAFAQERPDIGGEGKVIGGPEEPQRFPAQPIEVPREISQFFPQGIGGEFITPSAQALQRLSFTGREQLMGGVLFRGEQPSEFLEDIERTLSPRRRGPRTAPIAFA